MNRESVLVAIVNLRSDLAAYREARMYGKIADIYLEIARLQAILRNMKEPVLKS